MALAAGSAAAVTACRSDPPGTVADDGSVTVDHAFGETKVDRKSVV